MCIRDSIAAIKQTLERRRKELSELEERLKKSSLFTDDLQATIEALRAQIDAQAEDIAHLQAQLSIANNRIWRLTDTCLLYTSIGVLKLDMSPREELSAGNVGYIISGIKTSKEVKVGDTITHVDNPCSSSIEGFQEVKPMVFAGVYPIETEDFENLRSSLEKLQLNDCLLYTSCRNSGKTYCVELEIPLK